MTAHSRAALWMLGSACAFSLMAIAGRELAGRHDTFEIMFWRSVIGFTLVVSIATALKFYAITLIPLAQVFALEFTSPIWVILLSPVFLGERLTPPRIIATIMGFAGILIVTRPDMATVNAGTMAAAASAIFFAATVLMTKALTRGESIVSILFWLTLMQMILGLICALWDGQMRLPDAGTLPWLALIGLGGITAHLCLTTALSLAPASQVVPVDFLRLPVIAVVAALAYNEAIDPWVILGGAVIFAGNWINLRYAQGK
jgi:drug/metabolite transporter (DMT)-like permease